VKACEKCADLKAAGGAVSEVKEDYSGHCCCIQGHSGKVSAVKCGGPWRGRGASRGIDTTACMLLVLVLRVCVVLHGAS